MKYLKNICFVLDVIIDYIASPGTDIFASTANRKIYFIGYFEAMGWIMDWYF